MQARTEQLKALTPARIGVSRTGSRPLTSTWLSFRADHALARDAVHSEISESFIQQFATPRQFPLITSTAESRRDFILYPPKGKRAEQRVVTELQNVCPCDIDVQIVVSDGLSALAVEENLRDLLPMLEYGFEMSNITVGQIVIAKYARVAIADQIAHGLKAKIALNLIGERPGLSCASGLSAYITYNPGPQTVSSDRTVVSNIHKGGTPPTEAGAFIVKTIERILDKKVSGVKLQKLG
ncbi:MAG: ethanolamine ammonia-lyase subunit EutC [Candidatus Melainabacteria bacterium]|nr:ethanolamine ammonia-lyase subunit EutC [Candidatus Melainabacteria bacterium]